MNNKEIAEGIVKKYANTIALRKEIEGALDKASGKVKSEPEFEFGQRIIVNDLAGKEQLAVYGYRTQDGNHGVLRVGDLDTTVVDRCIPDPDYAKTLTFIKHDISDKCPIGYDTNIIAIYSNPKDSGSYYGRAENTAWHYVISYAIIPEGFLV